ncbi:hypothetical protein LKMONMHP_3925 [Methylobacterium organophilum]|uniref:General stress protein 17M-like domain-containing protein n=1 Tax=Methylobacterium organophilum TaxID=410 RepID=A0ABQ4TFZ8_METOR|nr:hypothetical protein [Methylobacterium organophilum]GJE29050.1 hypothetical protein LKMONMHP_3925 [Methylobacterium organophilum]
MAARTITALFDDYEEAARAIDAVEAEGVPHAAISIVASNPDDRHSGRVPPQPPGRPTTVAGHDAADGAGTGAAVGTVIGGGAGLLAGLGLLAIPGIGPVVAAGWLVATVAGAGFGAATGGLLGALTGAGLSEADAEAYAEGVRRGGTLVTVRAEEDLADRVLHILERGGSIDLDERASDWRSQGWQATGAPSANPVPAPPSATLPAAAAAVPPAATPAAPPGSSTHSVPVPTPEDDDEAEPFSSGEPRPSTDPTHAPHTRQVPGGIR